jgi:hypothetical protein
MWRRTIRLPVIESIFSQNIFPYLPKGVGFFVSLPFEITKGKRE